MEEGANLSIYDPKVRLETAHLLESREDTELVRKVLYTVHCDVLGLYLELVYQNNNKDVNKYGRFPGRVFHILYVYTSWLNIKAFIE